MGNKARKSLKGSGSLPTYFTSTEPHSPGMIDIGEEDKMVSANSNGSTLIKHDLQDLGMDLKSHFSSINAPKLTLFTSRLNGCDQTCTTGKCDQPVTLW